MLKLRATRCVVRQVYHSRCFASLDGAAQDVKNASKGRGPPKHANTTKNVWRNILNRQFEGIKRSSLLTGDKQKRSLVEPYLIAQAELLQPQEVKNALLEGLTAASATITPAQVGILLHSYAKVDKLGSAERLIQQWLQSYITNHPGDQHAVDLHRRLVDGSASAAAGTQNPAYSEGFDNAMKQVGKEEIPLSAWVALLTVYGRRRAWRQCMDVLTYLEHKRDSKQAYTINISKANGVLVQNLSELMLPTFIVSTEFANLAAGQSAVKRLSRGVNSSNLAVLQWASLYNITLRALVETHQYTSATDLLRRMRAVSGDEQGTNQMAQIPAAISLLSALSGPFNPLQDMMTSGGDVQEPVRHSIEVRQTLARSLLDSVASAVKTLAVPINRISPQKDNSNKTSQSWRVEKEDITAYTLAKQYVLLLCRLDLLEDCKLFVTDVRTHILNVRYGRPNQHNNFVSSTTVGGVEIIDKIIPVAGFWEDGWIAPYFRRCRELNRWTEAASLYDALQETKRYEDGVRRANLHLPENFSGPGLKEYQNVVIRRARGQEGVDDFVTPKQTPLKKSDAYMYHDTAAALRKAGDFKKLAELMSQHKTAAAAATN